MASRAILFLRSTIRTSVPVADHAFYKLVAINFQTVTGKATEVSNMAAGRGRPADGAELAEWA